MEKYKTISEDIENVSNRDVVKHSRISGIGVGMIVAAVVCAIAGKSFEDPNSSLPAFFFTVSALLLLAGIVKVFVGRTCYTFKPTKSRLQPFTLYFDVHESVALQNCVEMKRFDELNRLKREKDTGIKLEAMVTGDGTFAALQISEYVPYTYEAITPVRCYYGDDARTLFSYRIDAAPRYNPTSLVFFYGACSLFQKLNVVFRIG